MGSTTRPPSPVLRGTFIDREGVSLMYPNAGLSTYFLQPLTDARDDMTKEKSSRLDVMLESNCVFLKGTGVDVEPAYLTGQVALTLTEPTNLKELTLHFRGKARLPVPASESLMNNNSSLTYTVCNHDWSFLEGDKKHSRTLKEGRHVFPFQLLIGGSLPSSIATLDSGASVMYRLRAQATRPGFSHNLQANVPIFIIRSFSHEALEYQQTLEIENTWPDKLMYSIMLPHKAWAAGDTITAVGKFSPLNKGTSIVDVTSSLYETTSIYGRTGAHEQVRVLTSVKYPIVNGEHANASTSNHRLEGSQEIQAEGDDAVRDNNDLETTLSLSLPRTIVPTHGVEPIVVSHRIRWNIHIANPDGHTSELRCSLPIHILDGRLLQEARRHTASTRRLLLGGPEIPISEEEDMELPSYTSHVRDRVASMGVPDLVRVGFSHASTASSSTTPLTPDGNTTIGSNGGVQSSYSSPHQPNPFSHLPHLPEPGENTLEWITSELLSQQQRHSGTGFRTSSVVPDEPIDSDVSHPASRPFSRPPSRHSSFALSRSTSPDSHYTSGRSEPNSGSWHHHGARHFQGLLKAMKPLTQLSPSHWLRKSDSHGNLVFSEQQPTTDRRSRSRPQSPVQSPPVQPAGPHTTFPHRVPDRAGRRRWSFHPRLSDTPFSVPSSPSTVDRESMCFLQALRELTQVPDYDVASRGFMGGLPPLTSLQGLPSYEEAAMSASSVPNNSGWELNEERGLTQGQRARSESDLVTQMRS